MTKSTFTPKIRNYKAVSLMAKKELISMFRQGFVVKHAAQILDIHYSNAKKIVQDFKKGRALSTK